LWTNDDQILNMAHDYRNDLASEKIEYKCFFFS